MTGGLLALWVTKDLDFKGQVIFILMMLIFLGVAIYSTRKLRK